MDDLIVEGGAVDVDMIGGGWRRIEGGIYGINLMKNQSRNQK